MFRLKLVQLCNSHKMLQESTTAGNTLSTHRQKPDIANLRALVFPLIGSFKFEYQCSEHQMGCYSVKKKIIFHLFMIN